MADTNHPAPTTAPVEGDGISYSGIVWFIAVLTGTTVFCQLLVWVMFDVMQNRLHPLSDGAPRSAVAAPAATPTIQNGRLISGTDTPPQPGLLVSEPTVLSDFRKSEDQVLTTYGWMDKGSETVRIPVDRAKELVLQRGLPTRPAGAPVATASVGDPIKPAAGAKSAPAMPKGGK